MPTVLLLGAASDVAIAIARKFSSLGYNLQLAARNAERLRILQSDVVIRYAVSCSIHEFNATDFNSHASFFDGLPVKPDITICIFGYLGENELAWNDWQECLQILNTNYVGAISILNVVSRQYVVDGKGIIVGISSVAGERGRQSNFLYGSAKAGFTTYLSGLRNRLFREKVHVVSVLPGFIYTKMTEGLQLPKLLTAYPQQVADTIYYAVVKKKNVVYIKWFWFWIMIIIKSIPEPIFKKMKL